MQDPNDPYGFRPDILLGSTGTSSSPMTNGPSDPIHRVLVGSGLPPPQLPMDGNQAWASNGHDPHAPYQALQDQDLNHLPPRRRIPRPRKACINCRGLKIKCLPPSDASDPTNPCARCTRLRLDCEYTVSRRRRALVAEATTKNESSSSDSASRERSRTPPPAPGRSAKRPAIPSVTEQIPTAPPLVDFENMNTASGPSQQTHWPNSNALDFGTMGEVSNGLTVSPTQQTHGVTYQVPAPIASSEPVMVAQMEVERPPLSAFDLSHLSNSPLAGLLPNHAQLTQDGNEASPQSPESSTFPFSPPAKPTQPHSSDAIEMGLLAEDEARYLFQQFAERVSHSSNLFDHEYSTYERVRTSPVLFNSIMFAICKFYRPELVESMLDLAETAIFRCMRVAYYDVPLVQGILTLVYWKRPGDRTSYIKVCLARRCLQQLGLRLDFSLPNTAKPIMEERARVDVIRTVLNANIFESSHSSLLRLPHMGDEFPGSQALMEWASNHKHLGVKDDFYKVFLGEYFELFIVRERRFMELEADQLSNSAAELNLLFITRFQILMERWKAGGLLDPLSTDLCTIMCNNALLRLQLLVLRHKAAGGTAADPSISAASSTASMPPSSLPTLPDISSSYSQSTSDMRVNDLSAVTPAPPITPASVSRGPLPLPRPNVTASTMLDIVEEIGSVIRHLCTSGEILYISDISLCKLSSTVLRIWKGREYWDNNALQRALRFAREMSGLLGDSCDQIKGDHAVHYIRRSYRRLVTALEKYIAGTLTPGVSDSSLLALYVARHQHWQAGQLGLNALGNDNSLIDEVLPFPMH